MRGKEGARLYEGVSGREGDRGRICILINLTKLFWIYRYTEKPNETERGSFDASGTFHEGDIYSHKEEVYLEAIL